MQKWQNLGSKLVYENPVLTVENVVRRLPGAEPADYVALHAPDWVNVLAVTQDGKVVLINQWRHGICAETLEIPGGMVDPGESPEKAAARELKEETGFVSDNWLKLGSVNPNPALFDNRCYTFLALDAWQEGEARPEDTEQIEVQKEPLQNLPELVSQGRIDHSLVVSALALYWLKYPGSLPVEPAV
ncbi:NUDIX hydrolase [Dethiosulfatarculus sandiegensis]|uniref:GDP-mannose pyrophosphatase n=1 Tax=Dethiosulfatarculus sandiegensis TaxID=1429043 RepID=A0A0D2GLP7_9BACT|nr:NUDIX hydrolase [Dethiosulfatarculus sandiegensis]KIX15597.1 NUDIX hydrolase [Dethiosulfatarculus sandiegensis]